MKQVYLTGDGIQNKTAASRPANRLNSTRVARFGGWAGDDGIEPKNNAKMAPDIALQSAFSKNIKKAILV